MSVEKQEAYDRMDLAFQDGSFKIASSETLHHYLISLANQNIPNTQVQHRDVIRGLTINHILLQRHIEGLNKQNSKTQKLVIALTVASLIGTFAQIWYAANADKTPEIKTPPIATSQPPQNTKSAIPSRLVPASSGQAIKKMP